MSFKKLFLGLPFLLLFSVISSAQSKFVKDDLGFAFQLSSPPQKIISLAPNITEILFALELEKRIVGVTRYCDYPAQARQKEKIGGLIDPSLEKIKALNPDLIIGFRGNPLRILKRLRSLGFPVFILEAGESLDSIYFTIEKIGTITHQEKQAQALVSSLKNKYEKIEASLRPVRHKPRVFLFLHGLGFWTCGKGSFLNDLLTKAKGENVSGKIPKKWLHYSQEQLLHDNPEVMIVMSKSQQEFTRARQWIREESHLEKVRAVEEDRIYFLDENLASRLGPRLFDALAELARLLHPHLFAEKK